MSNGEYNSENTEYQSRTSRNKELYKKINDSDLGNYNVNSNVSVLDVEGNNINIEKLRQILDKKYREPQKRRNIEIENVEYEKPRTIEQTKEYDLDNYLERAKANKISDYNKERLKKLRDTQFNILQDIHVDEEEESPKSEAERELETLIMTITNKENIKRIEKSNKNDEINPFDILSDLKGNENTEVVPPIKETNGSNNNDDEQQNETENFYTGKLKVTDDDYEDFMDLKNEIKSNNVIIKVLLTIFFIIVLLVVLYFLSKTFNWGIF